MGKEKNSKEIKKNAISEVVINYIKTNDYKTFHTDGVFGGLTPNGTICGNFFMQRNAIPTSVLYSLKDGAINTEISRESKVGAVREIQTGVVMNV